MACFVGKQHESFGPLVTAQKIRAVFQRSRPCLALKNILKQFVWARGSACIVGSAGAAARRRMEWTIKLTSQFSVHVNDGVLYRAELS